MPDIGDFIRRSRRSAKIGIAASGTPVKIARCVTGVMVIFFFIIINTLLTVTYNIYLTYTTLHYTIKQNTTYLIQYSTYTIGNTLYLHYYAIQDLIFTILFFFFFFFFFFFTNNTTTTYIFFLAIM